MIECMNMWRIFAVGMVGYVCSKDHVFYHNLLPLSFSFLIWIKHDEEDQSLEQLLGWIHWKSEFT